MQSHVRILGILHIVFGALGILAGLAAFLFFGGIAGLIGITESGGDAMIAIPIMGTIGSAILALALLLSLPGLIAGIGLLSYRPWARMLMIVLSAFHILNFPFGTALGVYGFWILFSPEVTSQFQTRARYIS